MSTTTKNITTVNRIQHPVNMLYLKTLQTIDPLLTYAKFGQGVSMPMHEGENARWERWDRLATATTPLGTLDPDPVMPSKTDLTAAVREYGTLVNIHSWLDMTGLGSNQANITQRLKVQMAETLDELCRACLIGSASSATCSNGTGTATFLNRTDIDTAVLALMNEDIAMITPMMGAASGQGTSPIRDAYVAIANTACMKKLEDVEGFKHVSSYADPKDRYPGEWGSIGNTRWILTTKGYYDGSTYYYATFLGQDAYGTVKIKGGDGPMIYNTALQSNGLHRYSQLGWKQNYASKILSEVSVYNLKFTV